MKRSKSAYTWGDGSILIDRTGNSKSRIYGKTEQLLGDEDEISQDMSVDFPSGVTRLELSTKGTPLASSGVFADAVWRPAGLAFDPAKIVELLRYEFPPVKVGNVANSLDIMLYGNSPELVALLAQHREHVLNPFLSRNKGSLNYHRKRIRETQVVLEEGGFEVGVPPVEMLISLFEDRDRKGNDEFAYYVQAFDLSHQPIPRIPRLLKDVRPKLESWPPGFTVTSAPVEGDLENRDR